MRLGLIIYGSLETLSGGYLYDRKLVERLREAGDHVEVISMPWRDYLGRLAHNFDPAWIKHLAGAKYDVLLEDELNHPSLFRINRALRPICDFPIVSIVHHLRSSEDHPSALTTIYRTVERNYLKSLDGYIFNSQTTCDAVEKMIGDQACGVVATPAGDRFGKTASEDEIRSRVLAPAPLRILFTGNLIPRKGLETLLRGVAGLDSRDWRLRLVGRTDIDRIYAGHMRELAIQEGIAGQVDFLGGLSDADLEIEFRNAHILAVPSTYEGFGIVYLEAMGFGVPAIGSTAGGAGEIVQHGINGALIHPGDSSDLTRCLKPLMQDRVKLLEMSLNARKRFDAFPGWAKSMDIARAYLLTVKRQ
jgi:glycosyltransferase involved in cell wall biosynthesis